MSSQRREVIFVPLLIAIPVLLFIAIPSSISLSIFRYQQGHLSYKGPLLQLTFSFFAYPKNWCIRNKTALEANKGLRKKAHKPQLFRLVSRQKTFEKSSQRIIHNSGPKIKALCAKEGRRKAFAENFLMQTGFFLAPFFGTLPLHKQDFVHAKVRFRQICRLLENFSALSGNLQVDFSPLTWRRHFREWNEQTELRNLFPKRSRKRNCSGVTFFCVFSLYENAKNFQIFLARPCMNANSERKVGRHAQNGRCIAHFAFGMEIKVSISLFRPRLSNKLRMSLLKANWVAKFLCGSNLQFSGWKIRKCEHWVNKALVHSRVLTWPPKKRKFKVASGLLCRG